MMTVVCEGVFLGLATAKEEEKELTMEKLFHLGK